MSARAGVHAKGKFSWADAITEIKLSKGFAESGAIATFVGVARGKNAKGDKVTKLLLEAYEEKANEVLARICDDLRKRKGIVDVQIHHLLGEFSVGEDLVYVLVAGSHRKLVFETLEEAVELYKRKAPIFKKEYVLTKRGNKRAYWVSEKQDASRD